MKNVLKHPLLRGTALMLFAAVTLYGCKDFLTNASTPQGTLTGQTLLNRGGVEGTLIAAYRALDWNTGVGGNWGSTASNWVWGSVTSDDAYKGSEATDQPSINDVEAYHWSTANVEGYLNEKWRGVYEGVVRANAAINLLRQVQTASPNEITAVDARGIEGEAIFLRAHFHFEAYRMWGNIPYYREDDKDYRKANLTQAEVITQILADLDEAISLLPTTPRNGQVGRATSWTAKAYKGRVQVYAGQYAAAIATLTEVRASGVYALESSFERVWTGFGDIDNGKETILAYQASSNDGEPNGDNANYGERLNFPHSGSHFGCCGFHQPSQNLVNFYQVDNATGLPLALTDANWNARNTNLTSSTIVPVDPRLDWTVGRDGVPYKDWGVHLPSWIRAPAYGGPYSPKKHIHERLSGAEQTSGGWAPAQQNSVNIHIYRWADALLLLAEAYVETNNLPAALLIVNEIRARAGATAQGPGTDRPSMAIPIDDARITWADYRIGLYPAFPTQAYAREAVRNERRLELAMEGQRFFDLRRWGTAVSVLNGFLDGVGGGNEKARRAHLLAAEPVVTRHQLYPIPAIQIQLSRVDGTPMLTQNPGW